MSGGIAGVRILLVEDEPIIAMTAEDMLCELGCTVALTVGTLSDALEAAEAAEFDAAMLDINLNGVDSLPVAALLKRLRRPFIFTTGYGASGCGADHGDVPLVTKPYQLADLEQALMRAMAGT